MRRLLPILVLFALIAGAAVALARVVDSPPARAATISASSGAFEITDSKESEPIFAAAGIAPGDSTTGTVTIEDPGTEPLALTLHRGELVDEPGSGGGLLSDRLRLTVLDVTNPASPRTVYAGPLDSMPDQAAGRLESGESRTFEFVATLPDSGDTVVDNQVQGASTTVAYSWVAGEAGGGEPGEEEGGEEPAKETPGGGGSPGGPNYNPGGTTPGGGVSSAAAHLDLTVPKVKSRLRRGRLVVWTHCDETCRVTVRGRISAANGLGRHRVAKIRFTAKNYYAAGGKRLRIRIPHGMRHWLKVTPGRKRVRAKIRVIAVGTDGQRDVVKKTVKLRSTRAKND